MHIHTCGLLGGRVRLDIGKWEGRVVGFSWLKLPPIAFTKCKTSSFQIIVWSTHWSWTRPWEGQIDDNRNTCSCPSQCYTTRCMEIRHWEASGGCGSGLFSWLTAPEGNDQDCIRPMHDWPLESLKYSDLLKNCTTCRGEEDRQFPNVRDSWVYWIAFLVEQRLYTWQKY